MAAPSTTALAVPSGIPLYDGFSTRIMFSQDTDLGIWVKDLQPPAIDGGDMIDITTMHATLWRTGFPRSLLSLNEFTLTCLWDPDVYTSFATIINTNGSITVHLPDSSTLDFWGYARMWEPDTNEEGTAPESTLTVQPTNWDKSNAVEAGPVMTEVAGS